MGSRSKSDRPPSSESDVLLEKAKAGDNEALGKLLERSRVQLLDRARQLIPPFLRQKLGPSDLVQQTFKEAARDFAQFQHGRAVEFRAWLGELLANNARDAKRRYVASNKRDVRREKRLLDQLSRLLPRTDASPTARLESDEELAQLHAGISRLKASYQAILELAYSQGLSDAEIARHLNDAKTPGDKDKSEDAVRMMRGRAIIELKKEQRRKP